MIEKQIEPFEAHFSHSLASSLRDRRKWPLSLVSCRVASKRNATRATSAPLPAINLSTLFDQLKTWGQSISNCALVVFNGDLCQPSETTTSEPLQCDQDERARLDYEQSVSISLLANKQQQQQQSYLSHICAHIHLIQIHIITISIIIIIVSVVIIIYTNFEFKTRA